MGSSGGAGGNTLASIGLSAYSTMLSAEGKSSADEFQADKLENAATYGELKADQTNAQMSRSLNRSLGNIEAVRAASNVDPTSPTTAAIMDDQEMIGTEQRTNTVNSILQQARQDKADAAYFRDAAKFELFSGGISAAAGIAKGLAGGMPSG